MTTTGDRPSPTITDLPSDAADAFAALSPLRREVLLGHLAGLGVPALAERVGRSPRDTVALLASSLQCWADLLTAAGTASGPGRAMAARMAAGPRICASGTVVAWSPCSRPTRHGSSPTSVAPPRVVAGWSPSVWRAPWCWRRRPPRSS